MFVTLFSKSVLDPQSIREQFNHTITKNIDANKIKPEHPLAILNAFNELMFPEPGYINTFETADRALDLIHINILALLQDGTHLQILNSFRRVKNTKLKATEGYTFAVFSGTLSDWRFDLIDSFKTTNVNNREFATRVTRVFEELGINKSFLGYLITTKLDNLYYLEKIR